MGIFDEFKRLAHPYEDEEEDDLDEFDISPRPVERRSGPSGLPGTTPPPLRRERRSNKVVNIRAATQLQVVLVKPDKFEDASAIADHLREKRTVVLNLSPPTRRSPAACWTSCPGGLRQRGQDQEGSHLHLHHHPLQCGHPGRPD